MRGKRLRQTGGLGFREHPRVCGENKTCLDFGGFSVGTSPRMRENQGGLDAGTPEFRNIPAYAGKTIMLGRIPCSTSEHPCVCGENFRPVEGEKSAKGTSPRMRGKRRVLHLNPPNRRNIPAYAGKPAAPPPSAAHDSEHPRVCGENRRHYACRPSSGGTSPRMRGKHQGDEEGGKNFRNIPAYAGKTGIGG